MQYTRDQVIDWLNGLNTGKLDLEIDNVGLALSALALLEEPEPMPEDLSPHFTLDELTYSDTALQRNLSNEPNEAQVEQLGELANRTLEKIRALCDDKPMLISSGFRSPEVNAAVGGVYDSAHAHGCAADFTIPDFGTVAQVYEHLKPHLKELEIDQLIHERGGGAEWIHVGRAIPPHKPRHQWFELME